MRNLLRRGLICMLALAFAASGASWRQCVAAPQSHDRAVAAHAAQAVAVQAQHDASSHHAMHQHGAHAPDMHQQHHMQAAASADPAGAQQPQPDDHACLKCCSICTAAAAASPGTVQAVTFIATPAVFFPAVAALPQRALLLDPDIPKHAL